MYEVFCFLASLCAYAPQIVLLVLIASGKLQRHVVRGGVIETHGPCHVCSLLLI